MARAVAAANETEMRCGESVSTAFRPLATLAPYSVSTAGEGRVDPAERACRSLEDAPAARIADVHRRMMHWLRAQVRASAPAGASARQAAPPLGAKTKAKAKTKAQAAATAAAAPEAAPEGAAARRAPLTLKVVHRNATALLAQWEAAFQVRWLACDFHDMVVEMRRRPVGETLRETLTLYCEGDAEQQQQQQRPHSQRGPPWDSGFLWGRRPVWLPFDAVETRRYGVYAALVLRMCYCEWLADDVRALVRPPAQMADDVRVVYELYDQHLPLSLCCEQTNRYSDAALCDVPYDAAAPENRGAAAQRLGVFVSTYQHWYPDVGKAMHRGSAPDLTSLVMRMPLWSRSDPLRFAFPTAAHEVTQFIRSLDPAAAPSVSAQGPPSPQAPPNNDGGDGDDDALGGDDDGDDDGDDASGEGPYDDDGDVDVDVGGGSLKKRKKKYVKLRDRGSRATMRDLEALLHIMRRAFPQKSAARSFSKGVVAAFRASPTVFHAFVRMLACTLLGVYPDTHHASAPVLRRAVYRWFVVEYPTLNDVKNMLLRRVYVKPVPAATAAAAAAAVADDDDVDYDADENNDDDDGDMDDGDGDDVDDDMDDDMGNDSDDDTDDDTDNDSGGGGGRRRKSSASVASAPKAAAGKAKAPAKMFLTEFVGVYAVRECMYHCMKQVVGMYRMLTATYAFDRIVAFDLRALDNVREYLCYRLTTTRWRDVTAAPSPPPAPAQGSPLERAAARATAAARPPWHGADDAVQWYMAPWTGFPHVAQTTVRDHDTDIGVHDWASPFFGSQFDAPRILIEARSASKDDTFNPMETPMFVHAVELFALFDGEHLGDAEYARSRTACRQAYAPLLRAFFNRIARPYEIGFSCITCLCNVSWVSVYELERAAQLYNNETRRSSVKKSLDALLRRRALHDFNALRVFFEEQQRRCGFHAATLPAAVLRQQLRTFCRYYNVTAADAVDDVPTELAQYYVCMHCGTFCAEVVNNAFTTGVAELTNEARLRRVAIGKRSSKSKGARPAAATAPKGGGAGGAGGLVRGSRGGGGSGGGGGGALSAKQEAAALRVNAQPLLDVHYRQMHNALAVGVTETLATGVARQRALPLVSADDRPFVPVDGGPEGMRSDAAHDVVESLLRRLGLRVLPAASKTIEHKAMRHVSTDLLTGEHCCTHAAQMRFSPIERWETAATTMPGVYSYEHLDIVNFPRPDSQKRRKTSMLDELALEFLATTATGGGGDGSGGARPRRVSREQQKAHAVSVLRRERLQCAPHDLRAVNMLGRMVYLYGAYYLMCPLCLSITTYHPLKFSAIGFSCGECAPLDEMRGEISRQQLHSTLRLPCFLCSPSAPLHALETLTARRVLDDGARNGGRAAVAGHMTLETVYLCEDHVFAVVGQNADMLPRLSEVLRRVASHSTRHFYVPKHQAERAITVAEGDAEYDEYSRRVWDLPKRPADGAAPKAAEDGAAGNDNEN